MLRLCTMHIGLCDASGDHIYTSYLKNHWSKTKFAEFGILIKQTPVKTS